MGLDTGYREWRTASDEGVAASFGPASLTYSTFNLMGDGQETFDLRFIGTGPGVSLGLRLSTAQQMAFEAVNSVANQAVSTATTSESAAVAFVGETRSAQSFGGVGHVIELSSSLGVGLTFQILLFNIAFGPPQLVLALEIAIKFAKGELNRSRLNHLAPAVALLYAPSVGAGAGATIFVGHFDVSAQTTRQRTPRDGVGAGQSMNRRIRPHR